MPKILFVEDDKEQISVMKSCIEGCGHSLDIATDAQSALEYIAVSRYDLFILDWNLPDGTGLQLLQQIRRSGESVPVLMLTGNSTIEHKEQGFGSGVDDYLVKPFDFHELRMRIEALLRRPLNYTGVVLRGGSLEIDTQTYQVRKNGVLLKLQPKEFSLLTFFMRNQRVVFSSEAILDRVWSLDSAQEPESVRKVIQRLREKIDDEGCESIIKTNHTRGYSFEP